MSGLGEQIAVLDGLAAMDPNDGRIGQQRAAVDQYGRPVMRGVLSRKNVIDPSEGANYTGGSDHAAGMPLMVSSIGLAGIPSVLPTRQHVVDYSGGAQYSGGSSWAPGLPLLPSSSGLADAIIRGGYGRAGLGAAFIQGGYGRAGLGSTGSYVDEDLAGAMEAMEVGRALDPNDGRIGQHQVAVDEYGKQIMPGVLARSNVLDASEGANYSGGSSYAPRLPLLPSSVGLAGFDGALAELQSYDDLDGLDLAMPARLRAVAGRKKIASIKKKARGVAKKAVKARVTGNNRAYTLCMQRLRSCAGQLARARGIRAQAARQTAAAMRVIPGIPLPTARGAAYTAATRAFRR